MSPSENFLDDPAWLTTGHCPATPLPPPAPGRRSATVPAPAKLNLFLHVVGRRADGYHLLQSVFRLIDWCDWIELRVRDDGVITRSVAAVASPYVEAYAAVREEHDLTVRAAQLLRATYGTPTLGAEIIVHKFLPLGGGVGGGSSDAASVLLALNRLWGLGRSRAELMALATQLGADVPFFLFGHDAFVEGIGESLTPWALPAAQFWVLDPGVSVATAAVFASPLLTRNTPCIKIAHLDRRQTRNDLEPVACALYPQVKEALDWLRTFGMARMSGSGGCCYVTSDADLPEPPFGRLRRCRSIGEHPLRHWVE